MTADYGNQIYKNGDNHTEDPEKNYRFVSRLGNNDTEGFVRFVVPDDKYPLKPDQLLFLLTFELPSNYVPDNDIHAKMIKQLEVKILDSIIFQSYDNYQYFLLNHMLTKLNYSNYAQDTELFYRGRFDHYDCPADEMESTKVKYNGLNLIENRQQYATKKWIREKADSFGNLTDVVIESLSYVYNFKCPIAHGITRQPKVIPPGSKLEFDISFHKPEYALMKPSEYREYRVKKNGKGGVVFNADSVEWTEDSLYMMEEMAVWHKKSDPTSCICDPGSDGNIGDGDNKQISHLEYEAELYMPNIIKQSNYEEYFNTDGTIKKDHIAITKKPKLSEKTTVDDDGIETEWIHFFKKYNMDPQSDAAATNEEKTNKIVMEDLLTSIQLESVFCNAAKKEMPISVSKKLKKIPLYYPKLQIQTLRTGLKTYEIELHSGTLPYMIIFTGRSNKSTLSPTFNSSVTQTSLNENNHKIVEFSAFLNNRRILRTPWNHGLDHYINFIKHTGRFENKTFGGSTDYFHFLKQNWMVPIRLDEWEGQEGTVTVEITFEEKITLETLWDAYIMKIPSANLILDSNLKGNLIFFYF